jgi:hypothetical protein
MRVTKTKKRVPWRGWSKEGPNDAQKTVMWHKCGKKCFLGPNASFPICKKNTCKRSVRGIYAAYVRARQYRTKSTKYGRIASNARVLLKKTRKTQN